jgi:N-acetylmuramoyl-L-alanine amidase
VVCLLLAAVAFLLGACAEIETPRGVRKTSRTFTTVVLDAGHGAHDSGARTRRGTLEKDLALDVVLRVAPKLRAAGFNTVLTRKRDVFITLDDRVRISDRYENAVFVSVHFNDAGRKQVSGVESYYFSPESKQMAERMVRVLAGTTGAENRNARVARFRVLRMAQNPAVLMECGYITTTREAVLIVQPAYREKIAEGLARGIIQQRGGPLVVESKL